MIKYLGYAVTFSEIPEETTLCFNITNCPHRCIGCHSPQLQEDIGKDLEPDIKSIIDKYIGGITCVCFMGEGNDWVALEKCMRIVSDCYPDLKIALYTGLEGDGSNGDTSELQALDSYTTGRNPDGYDKCHEPLVTYLKLGKYDPQKGGLNSPSTNQRLFRTDYIDDFNCPVCENITSKFWKKGYHNGNNSNLIP